MEWKEVDGWGKRRGGRSGRKGRREGGRREEGLETRGAYDKV